MKQNMKHLVSFIALVVMLVSLFSAWVIPAAAAKVDYDSMLNQALVVNQEWENVREGAEIEYVFRGKKIEEPFNKKFHFASFADATAFIKANNRKNPIILLCAGTYAEKMDVIGNLTVLGPNAGMDPNNKTKDPKAAWTLKTNRSAEAVIKSSFVVRLAAGNANLTIDGLRFEDGGAVVDTQRKSGASTLTVKNSVFDNAGNTDISNRYALYLRSTGHTRTVYLENLYVTNMNKSKPAKGTTYDLSENAPDLSFIAPFFAKLFVNNMAYINNRNGLMTHTWFAKGVSPVVEVTGSCFYNSDSNMPNSYILSMDNYTYDYDFTYAPSTTSANAPLLGTDANPYNKDLFISAATDRPAASLKVHNNVFYQASGKDGVIHYQFVNANSVVDIQNNYVYANDNNANNGSSVLASEFLHNSAGVNQTNCMVIKSNRLIGAYKIPSLLDSNDETYVDMTDNYFATSAGQVVAQPIFMAEEDQRLIRDRFWIDEAMTKTGEGWKMQIKDWLLAWVDDFNYSADIITYKSLDLGGKNYRFTAPDGYKVALYRTAVVSADGVILSVHPTTQIPNNELTDILLGNDPYNARKIYAQVTKNGDSSFAPFYTINIENMGELNSLENFADVFPADHLLYKAEVAGIKDGTIIPYRWKGKIYKFEAGKNIFSSVDKIFDYAAAKKMESPTIMFPCGVYTGEVVLRGACTIMGEQAGVNPNKTVVDTITKENIASSAWILNPLRNQSQETEFQNVIRVASGIDNYIITVDGIKMGSGCSYIDDTDRNGECVTIIKNVYAVDPVGGVDNKGVENKYLFNLNRASVNDRNHFYIYDSRIEGLDGKVAFGPVVEKFIVDGLYFGKCENLAQFTDSNFHSRDIPNPYYSITNSYFHANHTMGKTYVFNFKDDVGDQKIKTNIVYNFDNNVFFNGLTPGRGFQIYFTGNNMKLNFTNNTLVQEGDSDTLFVSTSTNSRFTGCKNQNVSDMMNIKGNRLIGKNCLPCTGGTGEGTMFDWSGNYFSGNYSSDALMPDGALRFGAALTPSDPGSYPYEEQIRVKIDYTFLDWDMTVRSDQVVTPEAKYAVLGKGTLKTVGGEKVYTDSVSADQKTYDIPFVPGDYSTLKVYSDELCTNQVAKLDLPNAENVYYAVVASNDGSVQEQIKIVITRALNTENELYYMDGFLINNTDNIITAYVDITGENFEYDFANATLETSTGAVCGLYLKKSCLESEKLSRPNMLLQPTCYLKVSSEKGNKSTIYTLNFVDSKAVDPSKEPLAAITYVNGMSRYDDRTFTANVVNSISSFTFIPYAHLGGSVAVYNGGSKMIANADGSYTVKVPGTSDTKLKAIATSGDGKSTAEYSLVIKKVKGNESALLEIEGATKKENTYLLNIGAKDAVILDATVSPGATYQVYEDYTCKTPCANNLIKVQKDGAYRDVFFVYVKVTSEDGKSSTVSKVTVQSIAANVLTADLTGTVNDTKYKGNTTGDKEYTLYLPAGTEKVALKGEVIRDTTDAYGNVKKDEVVAKMNFFADRNKTIPIEEDVILKQKVTKVYATMLTATYTKVVDGVKYSTVVPGFDGVVNIIADRTTVKYSDAASFSNSWVKEYVDYLNNGKYGIFTGDDAGKLNVNNKITRYEIAAVASRVLGLDTSKYTTANTKLDYTDAIADWALPYVRAVTSNGIMSGNLEGDKYYFNGNANATREQVIKVLVGVCMINDGITTDAPAYYAGKKATLDSAFNAFGFADVAKVSEWAVPYVKLAVAEYEMISGSDDGGKLNLNPKKDITRAEVSKMIAVYYGY